MSKASQTMAAVSNLGANRGAVDLSWRGLFRGIFPENTAANVATFARTGVRAAEYVVAGESQPSTRALINLLRSPIGAQVLDVLAGDADWRAVERRLLEIHELELELKNLEQKKRHLDGLLRQTAR